MCVYIYVISVQFCKKAFNRYLPSQQRWRKLRPPGRVFPRAVHSSAVKGLHAASIGFRVSQSLYMCTAQLTNTRMPSPIPPMDVKFCTHADHRHVDNKQCGLHSYVRMLSVAATARYLFSNSHSFFSSTPYL